MLASFFFPCFPFSYHTQDPLSPAARVLAAEAPSNDRLRAATARSHTAHQTASIPALGKAEARRRVEQPPAPRLRSLLRAPSSGCVTYLLESMESPLGHNPMDLPKYQRTQPLFYPCTPVPMSPSLSTRCLRFSGFTFFSVYLSAVPPRRCPLTPSFPFSVHCNLGSVCCFAQLEPSLYLMKSITLCSVQQTRFRRRC